MTEKKPQEQTKFSHPFKWTFDFVKKTFYCDPLLASFLGYKDHTNITIAQFFSVIDPRQIPIIKNAFQKVLAKKDSSTHQILLNIGKDRYAVEFSLSSDTSSSSKIVGLLKVNHKTPSIEQESMLLETLFHGGKRGCMIATNDHIIIKVNKAFCQENGYSESELIGQHARVLKSGHYTAEFYKDLWQRVDVDKSWHGELLAQKKNGDVYAHEVNFQRIDLDGEYFYFVSSSQLVFSTSMLTLQGNVKSSDHNIPDKEAYLKKLQNCYNELSGTNTIIVATFDVKLQQKSSLFLINWLVSQRFNLLHNNGGHLGILADGFYSVFWSESKNIEKINKNLIKLLHNLKGDATDDNLNLPSIVNIGVSILGVDSPSVNKLITNSAQVHLESRKTNKSGIHYYDRRLSKRFNRRETLAELLKEALSKKEINVFYQPIIEIPLMNVISFEALFRISLNTKIDYSIQELITIAEENNWIDQIDRMVSRLALNDLPKIQQHLQNPDITMSINRSLANDKKAQSCLQETLTVLQESKADLSKVIIELTESAVFEDIDQQLVWVQKFKELGIQIALDDFGTGYSSFTYINKLPIKYIKIDRSFVSNLTLNSHEYTMIEMLCSFAHKIGAKVIAEGVETKNEFALLSRAKVDQLQGYLLGRPTALQDIINHDFPSFPKELKELIYADSCSTVREITIKAFSTNIPEQRLLSIKAQIEKENLDYLLIVENSRCVGILHASDMYAVLSPYLDTKAEQHRDTVTLDKRAHQVMKKDFHTLNINSPIEEAQQILLDFPQAVIVITGEKGVCLGVTTIHEILRYKLIDQNMCDYEI
jgi:PAS domain S-box-containing protein